MQMETLDRAAAESGVAEAHGISWADKDLVGLRQKVVTTYEQTTLPRVCLALPALRLGPCHSPHCSPSATAGCRDWVLSAHSCLTETMKRDQSWEKDDSFAAGLRHGVLEATYHHHPQIDIQIFPATAMAVLKMHCPPYSPSCASSHQSHPGIYNDQL